MFTRCSLLTRASFFSLTCVALAATTSPLLAQWSPLDSVNLNICNRVGSQVQPKIRTLPDGSAYVSWLDNGAGGGYDTYLALLDPQGVALWPAGGIRIIDTSYTSTQDYGLDIDQDGNAVVAYRDDTTGTTQAAVQIIKPDGTLLIAPAATRLSNVTSSTFIASPKVTATSDGHYVITWTQGTGIAYQRIDASGAISWAPGGRSIAPASGSYLIADVQAGADGAAILLFVRATGNINAPRYLWTQKITTSGAQAWNGGIPQPVFEASSLQIGYFPTMVADGEGGVVYGWYENGGSRRAYVQRISSTGVFSFPVNGFAVATPTGKAAIGASVSFNRSTGDIFLIWPEVTIPTQNNWSVHAQRVNRDVAHWGDRGRTLQPLSTNQPSFAQGVAPAAGGVMAAWFEKSNPMKVVGAALNTDGDPRWDLPSGGGDGIIDLTSIAGSKGRLSVTLGGNDCLYAVWHDARNAAQEDIYGQVVNSDSTLGPCEAYCPADFNQDGGIDGADVESFFLLWSDGLLPADVNRDGGVDGSDVGFFFERWSAGGCA